jgi:hypothetical protein
VEVRGFGKQNRESNDKMKMTKTKVESTVKQLAYAYILTCLMLTQYNTYRCTRGSNAHRHQLSVAVDPLKAHLKFLCEDRN